MKKKHQPDSEQSKLFTIHEHDGNSDITSTEYLPELPDRPVEGTKRYFGSEIEEGYKKVKRLESLSDYMGHESVASLLNLRNMSEDHPSYSNSVANGNFYKAEGVLREVGRHLQLACGHCALFGTTECKIDSDPNTFISKYSTKAKRSVLIELNMIDPKTSC